MANLAFKPSWLSLLSGKRTVVIKHEIDSSPLKAAADFKPLSGLKTAMASKSVEKATYSPSTS